MRSTTNRATKTKPNSLIIIIRDEVSFMFSFHLRRSPLANLSAAGTTTVSDVERLQGIKERLRVVETWVLYPAATISSALKD
jgi:hypothetical protein